MRRVSLVAFLLVAGCNQLTPPIRDDYYNYEYIISKGIGGVDTLTFHWPRSLLPVRVWIAPDDALAPYLATALSRWENALLYGEFQSTMVSDSSTADIIFQNLESPTMSGIPAMATGCSGETDVDTAATAFSLQLPVHVWVWSNTNGPASSSCYSITTTHEIGHAIGILAHSPDSSDVMYAHPVFDGISTADRETAEILYHIQPTMTVVRSP